jgi:Tol biopolymer transport system component
VPGLNIPGDVFVHNSITGAITRVTQGNGDSDWPSVSADGRYVTFESEASNLIPGDTNGVEVIFVWDAVTGATTRVTDGNQRSERPAISGDGRYVTFQSYASNLGTNDTNGTLDVFRRDSVTCTFTRASPRCRQLQPVPDDHR